MKSMSTAWSTETIGAVAVPGAPGSTRGRLLAPTGSAHQGTGVLVSGLGRAGVGTDGVTYAVVPTTDVAYPHLDAPPV